MPTYEFHCNRCEKEFEKSLGMNDIIGVKCSYCNSKDIKQIISGEIGVILKGDGWVRDGYTKAGDKRKIKKKVKKVKNEKIKTESGNEET